MRFGSDSGWRPLERIDTVMVGTRGLQLIRVTAWWAPCRPTMASFTVRAVPGTVRHVVDSELLAVALDYDAATLAVDTEARWYDRDGNRGLRCPLLGVTVSVRVPTRIRPGPVAEVSRLVRRVTVAPTPAAALDGKGIGIRRARAHPGVYTRWPLPTDSGREAVLGRTPARIATGPATLFRDSDERRFAGSGTSSRSG